MVVEFISPLTMLVLVFDTNLLLTLLLAASGAVVYRGMTRRQPPETLAGSIENAKRSGEVGFISSAILKLSKFYPQEIDNGIRNAYEVIYDHPVDPTDLLLQRVIENEIQLERELERDFGAGNGTSSPISSPSLRGKMFRFMSAAIGQGSKFRQTIRVVSTVVTIKLRRRSPIRWLGVTVPSLDEIVTRTNGFCESCMATPPGIAGLVSEVGRYMDRIIATEDARAGLQQ